VLLGGQVHATIFCAQRNTLYQSDWILDGPRTWYLLPKKKKSYLPGIEFPTPWASIPVHHLAQFQPVTVFVVACDS
jgi:hypothetical protein